MKTLHHLDLILRGKLYCLTQILIIFLEIRKHRD